MTKISRYNIDDKVTGSDKWIGSDSQTQYSTKNFTPTKLAIYFNENQIIDIGSPIRYKYDILEVGDLRLPGTITFNPQVGTPYPISSISNFILSKYTLKGNDVSEYLNFLIGSKILLSKADDINIFGLFKIISIVENIVEPNFFDVVVSYITGNGTILEDREYLISLIDTTGGDDIPTLQNVVDTGNTVTNKNIEFFDDSTDDKSSIDNFSLLLSDDVSNISLEVTKEKILKKVSGFATDLIFQNPTSPNVIQIPDNSGIIALVGDIPTKTSDLTNDGEDGTHPFITLEDITIPTLQEVVNQGHTLSNDYINIINSENQLTNELANDYVQVSDNFNSDYSLLTCVGFQISNAVEIKSIIIDKDKITRAKGDFKTDLIFKDPTQDNLIQLPDNSGTIALTSDIPTVTGFVPYTGATQDVNLGEFDITATHLIKDGGQSTQFLKADGSVDNNVYLTSSDLPSTLDLYATTTASDVSGYTVLVRNISDSRFNTTAVDVSTGAITTTNQLVGSLVSDANIISGNPGIFNITTIGNISRTSGTGQAEFFFKVYKRDNLGVETFITESSKTLPVTNGGYVEFSAVALWNDGVFLDTDRVVLKYYADRLTSPVGSNPTYKFQFGGISPVRSTAAIPVAVLPNIYLRDLADVENVDALNNEVLYWNDADSLWEHSSVIGLLSPASSTVNGYLTSTDWTTFNGKFNLPSLTSGSVLFSNGTTIAQDNANLFYNDSTNILYANMDMGTF